MATRPENASTERDIPSFAAIREKVNQVFGKRACLWQCQAGQAILKNHHVIIDVATGMGKTLSFFIPSLFRANGIQLIVTALNVLGKQNEASLEAAGIRAISISADTAIDSNFRDIEEGKYRIVIISPEQLMKAGGGFERLMRKPAFAAKIDSVVFDEAHCISEWGSFRPEYRDVMQLRYRLPNTSFVFASATFTPSILADIKRSFNLTQDRLTHIHRSNDRPNIHIAVRKILYSLSSFLDLAFLVPDGWKDGDPPPPKFVIFFDSISDAVNAGRFLRKRLPPEYRHKIKWFHSDMSSRYKETAVEDLREGRIWGLCATDSFGMGVDLPDILLVIQWRLSCKMTTLWQRLGRGARNKTLEAVAIIFVEAKYFDDEIAKREHNKAQRRARAALKRKAGAPVRSKPAKRAKLDLPQERARVQGDDHMEGGESGTPQGLWFVSTEVAAAGEEFVARNADSAPLQEADTPESDGASSSDEEDVDTESQMPTLIDTYEAPSQLVDESAVDNIAARRDLYHEVITENSRAVVRREKQELELSLMDLINADSRGIGCRRVPFLAYFAPANETPASNTNQCDPSMPTGCTRCSLPSPQSCCDLHDPERSQHLQTPCTQKEKRTRRTRIKDFKFGPFDFDLRGALQKWRDSKVRELYGEGNLRQFGGSLVLPNDMLDRLVSCAHFKKLATVNDLKRETQWTEADKYAAEVLQLIAEHSAPAPTAASTTRAARTTANKNGEPGIKPRSIPRCSVCKQPGHNKSNKNCPGYQNPSYVACESTVPALSTSRREEPPTAAASVPPTTTSFRLQQSSTSAPHVYTGTYQFKSYLPDGAA
ncbi:hypothetical protein NM688_g3330 [Phlebia brevispora]|uniref:Uncharacterized protein n=1 Tax=Phlebia brevispora TaxID=194682 RepID=A0ACC1T686_9APHY|nr:hypothetical protein NM688_g3330 [Phlebia brevispora]